ncbi:MAG TPA: alcohol dehydrogenase catalytic domain-containing protein, partial [Firmicutes bacterium]|nr:alcohol dehydrogenase catalytic domain-containing protein [Bacillota bacterium]
MRAVQKVGKGPGAELREIDVPRPGPGEVLVKVKAASICGTDFHIYRWDEWSAHRIKPPLIMGHEFCG